MWDRQPVTAHTVGRVDHLVLVDRDPLSSRTPRRRSVSAFVLPTKTTTATASSLHLVPRTATSPRAACTRRRRPCATTTAANSPGRAAATVSATSLASTPPAPAPGGRPPPAPPPPANSPGRAAATVSATSLASTKASLTARSPHSAQPHSVKKQAMSWSPFGG